jgi:ABC-type dipeptide/oligopeptide/nickel transport system ATPase subunit
VIEVDGLTVTFGRGKDAVDAVRGLSFAVKQRETFGLVGESGSGKSTVLRALCGLAAGSGGSMRVAGSELGRGRSKEFHRLVQMVFQDPFGSLHPRHTVDRILGEPIAIQGLSGGDRRIARALAEVGLGPSFRYRYPHQLSGGQRQRVAIARALIMEPRILLLDEPTSALDVSIQAEILNLLLRVRAERALTSILVSHNLAVVAHLCDRLLVMNAGKAVEKMTVAELRSGTTAHAYTRQLLRASEGYDRRAAETFETFA